VAVVQGKKKAFQKVWTGEDADSSPHWHHVQSREIVSAA